MLNSDEKAPESTKEWDYCILVTRRGYWSYRLFQENGSIQLQDGQKVYSDRYISRCLDFSGMEGKKILVIDDSMNEGNRLFYFYTYLKNRTGGSGTVIPVIYNLNATYRGHQVSANRFGLYKSIFRGGCSSDEELMPGFQTEQEAFDRDLVYGIRVGANMINGFSVALTNTFQEDLCPLVMNLPMLRYDADSQEKDKRYVSLTGEQFEKLKEGNANWQFTQIHYREKDVNLNFGFFQMKNEEILRKTENFIYDLVVKCKYNTMPDGSVHLIFVPFAIVKSMSMLDTFRYFCALFAGTEYFRDAERDVFRIYGELFPQGECPDSMEQLSDEAVKRMMVYEPALCLKLYRSLIFEISDFVSGCFKIYARTAVGVSLKEDLEIMEENFEESFISTMKSKHQETSWMDSLADFLTDGTEPEWVQKGEIVSLAELPADDWDKESGRQNLSRRQASEEGIYNCFHDIVQEHKLAAEMKRRNISFEEVDHKLSARFLFDSDQQRRTYISGILLMMLEISCVGNDVLTDAASGMIIREFRPGENSDLYLGERLVYFYPYMYALSMKYPDGGLEERAVPCLERMEYFFKEKNYFGVLMSEEEFQFYKRYFLRFIGTGELKRHIENKQLLLDDYFSAPRGQGDRYIAEAFENMRQWAI